MRSSAKAYRLDFKIDGVVRLLAEQLHHLLLRQKVHVRTVEADEHVANMLQGRGE